MTVGGYMSGIFGSSPVKPMQQHMAKVLACVSELIPLFDAVIREDWDSVSASQQKISLLEKEADMLKKELRLQLPKGPFHVGIASGTGLPITPVGTVLSVGMARGMQALNLTVVRNIFMSWIVTLPAGSLLSILFFLSSRCVQLAGCKFRKFPVTCATPRQHRCGGQAGIWGTRC